MPHVNVRHWPGALSDAQRDRLAASITEAVSTAFECDPGVVSIALEPVAQEEWTERVYTPEVIERNELLIKAPNY